MSDVKLWNVQVVAAFTVTFTSGPDPDNYIYIYKNDGTLVVHGASEGGSFVYDLDLGVYDIDCSKEGFTPKHKEDLAVNQDLTYAFGDLEPLPQTIAEFTADSEWNTGPFQVGHIFARLANYKVTNTGNQDGLVYVELWEYPGTSHANRIFDTNFSVAADTTSPWRYINIDIPDLAFFQSKYPGIPPPWDWELCARVRGMSEEFESCTPGMSMTVGVVPSGWKEQRLVEGEFNPLVGLIVVAGVVAIPLLLLRK